MVAAFVSPKKDQRDLIKSQFEKDSIPFYEVFIKASLETCQTRDVKGDIYVPKFQLKDNPFFLFWNEHF